MDHYFAHLKFLVTEFRYHGATSQHADIIDIIDVNRHRVIISVELVGNSSLRLDSN